MGEITVNMRNIICNNCVGARLYQAENCQFQNPFMWCSEDSKDFMNLISQYDTLNLDDVSFSFERYRNKPNNSVLVTIPFNGGDIRCHFIHYVLDINQKAPVRVNETNDIKFCDIIDYAKDKWSRRQKRNTEEPLFLIIDNFKTNLDDFIGLQTRYKIVVFTPDVNKARRVFKNNAEIIKCPWGKEERSTVAIAKYLLANKKPIFL